MPRGGFRVAFRFQAKLAETTHPGIIRSYPVSRGDENIAI
jgi:hypothetical protein